MRLYATLACAAIALALAGCSSGPPSKQEIRENTTTFPTAQPSTGQYCTMDAMQCPDGSYVGRVPPSCNFAPCP
jgi:hypothetical protein